MEVTRTVEGTEPWRSAAQALLDEAGCGVRKWRSAMTGVSSNLAPEIEAPRPKTARSFAVFAHEIGHQRLHESNGNYPRWREEVEAWEFALEQFGRFGLEGRNKQRQVAVKCIGYAFTKAIRRGADPQLIHRTYPEWSRAVQRLEDERDGRLFQCPECATYQFQRSSVAPQCRNTTAHGAANTTYVRMLPVT